MANSHSRFAPWLTRTLTRTDLGIPGRYEGKVRDTYPLGDALILVSSDRISAFDHVLRQTIPCKGQVLNGIAAHFFAASADVVPNHVLAVPDPNVTVGIRCEPVPIEFVMRGYLVGHAWRTYRNGGRTLCGIALPDGLRQNEAFPEPIMTPATKATEGHDEDISREGILERGLLDAETLDLLEGYARALFAKGTAMAAERGLILVDTKYEFGRTLDGRYVVMDEIHTPDSSRYFYADTYADLLARDEPQRQLSKEFVREWLMANGFQGREGESLPDLTDSFRLEVTERYAELYEVLTGVRFEADPSSDPAGRIAENVARYAAQTGLSA